MTEPTSHQHELDGEKVRTTKCCCGDTWLTLRGEPERVIICHCIYCQRKTGSVANNSSWWIEDQIVDQNIDNVQLFNDTPANPGCDYYFCKRCGSTVFWRPNVKAGDYVSPDGSIVTVEKGSLPGHIAIAVGGFGDPDFPAPTDEYPLQSKHHWMPVIVKDEARVFDSFPPQEFVTFNAEWLAKYRPEK